MIRVILQGRTGNNLFQYAAGRALAHRHGVELVLDGSWADSALERQFRHLLRLPVVARYERSMSLPKRLGRKLRLIQPESWYPGTRYRDCGSGYEPAFERLSADTVLFGYFQGPRYFAGIADMLRNELDIEAVRLGDQSDRFEAVLRAGSFVSVHVRRGDYLNISSTNCLGDDYHQRAIDWLRQRHENLRFCLFSDDITWCRERFIGPEFEFSDFASAATDPLHDMKLMTACQHHIIVNSSYSWWGAWLGRSPGKTVVAPKTWMKSFSSENVVCDSWVRL